jgi:hypothetical protein
MLNLVVRRETARLLKVKIDPKRRRLGEKVLDLLGQKRAKWWDVVKTVMNTVYEIFGGFVD